MSSTLDLLHAEPVRLDGPTGSLAEGRAPAILDLLLTVGYIDGVFHERELAFVQQYLDAVIQRGGARAAQAGVGVERIRGDDRAELEAMFKRLNAEIAALAAEVISSAGSSYVPTRLKVRALSIFTTLAPAEQAIALELIRSLAHADGTITPQEQRLYDELVALFAEAARAAPAPAPAPAPTAKAPAAKGSAAKAAAAKAAAAATTLVPEPGSAVARPVQVTAPRWLALGSVSHPLLDPLEQTYSPHPVELRAQVALDYQLVTDSITQWHRMRERSNGRLAGVTDVGALPAGARFLDGHVHVIRPDRPLELIVLGDLHGCYGCLKAALLQSRFIERAWAHQWDPANHPEVKLVLLGDYIDRGRFSFDGVLRAVLRLFLTMPEQVIVLRGNHEYFLSAPAGVFSGVSPAEALTSITPHVPREMLEAYRILFEHMPTSLLVDRTLFVHGGIPREDTFADKYRDLSSLNDGEVRFQMLWSDPTQTDHVPVALQRQNPRFNFGRHQFRAFMERAGFHTLIRGHEKIDRGFEVVYDLGDRTLLNLFSAGGHDNVDLPIGASYRTVTPMALTILHGPDGAVATPWPIDYQPFNFDPHNGFHRVRPLLPFREY